MVLLSLNKIQLGVTFVFLVAFFSYHIMVVGPGLCEEKNELFNNMTIEANVERVYIDSANHMAKTIRLTDKLGTFTLELAIDTSLMWNHVEKGDSLLKLKGTNKVRVFGNNNPADYYVYYDCY